MKKFFKKRIQKKDVISLKTRFLYTIFMSLMLGYFSVAILGLDFNGSFADFITISALFFILPYLIFILQFLLKYFLKKEFPVRYINLNLKLRFKFIISFIFVSVVMIYFLKNAGLEILAFLPIYIGFLIFYGFWVLADLIKNYSFKWVFFSLFVLLDILIILFDLLLKI